MGVNALAAVHFATLASVVLGTIGCLVYRGGRARRPFWTILLATLPFYLIAITSLMVMSARGVPGVEWAIPGAAVIALACFCKSDAIFTAARWGLLAVSLLLCANFFYLTEGPFTGSPWRSESMRQSKLRADLLSLESVNANSEVPAGVVGKTTIGRVVSQWHTPLTGLYRIENREAVVWHPGGEVRQEKLEVRPL